MAAPMSRPTPCKKSQLLAADMTGEKQDKNYWLGKTFCSWGERGVLRVDKDTEWCSLNQSDKGTVWRMMQWQRKIEGSVKREAQGRTSRGKQEKRAKAMDRWGWMVHKCVMLSLAGLQTLSIIHLSSLPGWAYRLSATQPTASFN